MLQLAYYRMFTCTAACCTIIPLKKKCAKTHLMHDNLGQAAVPMHWDIIQLHYSTLCKWLLTFLLSAVLHRCNHAALRQSIQYKWVTSTPQMDTFFANAPHHIMHICALCCTVMLLTATVQCIGCRSHLCNAMP